MGVSGWPGDPAGSGCSRLSLATGSHLGEPGGGRGSPPPAFGLCLCFSKMVFDQLKSCGVLSSNSAFSNKQRQRTNGRESFNKP